MPRLLKFLDDMTNWYIKMNRARLKGNFGVDESMRSANILYNTLSKYSPQYATCDGVLLRAGLCKMKRIHLHGMMTLYISLSTGVHCIMLLKRV